MKKASVLLVAGLAMLGSACSVNNTTYTPTHDEGFVYNENKSFAFNVIDGSLGFHYGLMDAHVKSNADISSTGIDYAVLGTLGFMLDGVAGGVLGLFAATESTFPLDRSFGIAYVPVKEKSEAEITRVMEIINKDIVGATEKSSNVKYLHTVVEKQSGNGIVSSHVYTGDLCKKYHQDYPSYYDSRYYKEYRITSDNQCWLSKHTGLTTFRYSDVDPYGNKGLFAVMGIYEFSSLPTAMMLDEKYFFFLPKTPSNRAPFVVANDKVWFFTIPNDVHKKGHYIYKKDLFKLFPKLERKI